MNTQLMQLCLYLIWCEKVKKINMKKFNIEIELTKKELEFLAKVDWDAKAPHNPLGTEKEVFSLLEKGVIVEYIEGDYVDSAIFLTEVGKQIRHENIKVFSSN